MLTLDYAPGPMETDMNAEIMASKDTDEGVRAAFDKMKSESSYVRADVSANKCFQLALSGSFESGSHVDYFDLP